jgi:hypothetical protein
VAPLLDDPGTDREANQIRPVVDVELLHQDERKCPSVPGFRRRLLQYKGWAASSVAEHLTFNQRVVGSIPTRPTTFLSKLSDLRVLTSDAGNIDSAWFTLGETFSQSCVNLFPWRFRRQPAPVEQKV